MLILLPMLSKKVLSGCSAERPALALVVKLDCAVGAGAAPGACAACIELQVIKSKSVFPAGVSITVNDQVTGGSCAAASYLHGTCTKQGSLFKALRLRMRSTSVVSAIITAGNSQQAYTAASAELDKLGIAYTPLQ
eukprot:16032-Heterococcus_DN1.PRE.3